MKPIDNHRVSSRSPPQQGWGTSTIAWDGELVQRYEEDRRSEPNHNTRGRTRKRHVPHVPPNVRTASRVQVLVPSGGPVLTRHTARARLSTGARKEEWIDPRCCRRPPAVARRRAGTASPPPEFQAAACAARTPPYAGFAGFFFFFCISRRRQALQPVGFG